MKKLFFTALVAVVAVSGAFAIPLYTQTGDSPVVNCDISDQPTCEAAYPNTNLYTENNRTTAVNLSEYQFISYP